jgi:hypothetical protein
VRFLETLKSIAFPHDLSSRRGFTPAYVVSNGRGRDVLVVKSEAKGLFGRPDHRWNLTPLDTILWFRDRWDLTDQLSNYQRSRNNVEHSISCWQNNSTRIGIVMWNSWCIKYYRILFKPGKIYSKEELLRGDQRSRRKQENYSWMDT